VPQHRALEWLHEYGRRYPHAWNAYAMIQQSRDNYRRKAAKHLPFDELADTHLNWPEWCWCPLAAANEILALKTKEDFVKPKPETGGLGAVAAWRATQGIYRIDPTLFTEIVETPITGAIPSDVLKRLPEWCCYIESPGMKIKELPGAGGQDLALHGFFAFLEFDILEHAEVLRFALDVEGQDQLLPLMVHLGSTLEEGIFRTERFIKKSMLRRYDDADWWDSVARDETSYWNQAIALLPNLLSVVLYLCADETDVPRPAQRPPRFVITKKKKTIIPTGQPAIHECGVRLGAQLRWAAEQRELDERVGGDGTRTVHGHIRRAHFHTFWSGPRDGERVPRVKWLPPIRVKLDDVPTEATIRPVK
jgi:hypothetical protein